MIEKLYTVEEVAELASVTGRTIRNYLKSGRLIGRKIGGQWRFPESEVQRLLTGAEPEPAESAQFVEKETVLSNFPSQASTSPAMSHSQPASSPSYPDEYSVVSEPYSAKPSVTYFKQEEFLAEESYSTEEPIYEAHTQPHYNYDNYVSPAPVPKPTAPPVFPTGKPQDPHAVEQFEPPFQDHAPSYIPAGAPEYAPMPQAAHSQPAPQHYQPAPPQYPTQAASVYAEQMHPHGSLPNNPAVGTPVYVQQPPAYSPPAPAAPQEVPPPVYYQQPSPAAPVARAEPIAPSPAPVSEPAVQSPAASAPVEKTAAENNGGLPAPVFSDVGKQVMRFVAEVHDCSLGPQVCSVIDLHQTLPAAKATSERLAEIARQESEGGQLCQSFVEFDERYFVARYTLFGTSSFLARCVKLLG